MKLSEDRVSHLSHLMWDAIYDDDLVDYPDDDAALLCIKKTFADYMKIHDQIDDFAREKVASLKRGVQEGSREWDILYKKYFEEEADRRKF